MAKRKKRTTRRRPLSGIAGLNTNAIMDAAKKTGAILIGFLGGREVSRMIVKPNADGTAVTGIKAYIGAVAQAGGGILLASQSNDLVKCIGYGLAASGIAEGVSKVMNKDIVAAGFLKGLEGFSLGELFAGELNPGIEDKFLNQLKSNNPISGANQDFVS